MTNEEYYKQLSQLQPGVWYGAEYLESDYGITNISAFRHKVNGWGGKERYLLEWNWKEKFNKQIGLF